MYSQIFQVKNVKIYSHIEIPGAKILLWVTRGENMTTIMIVEDNAALGRLYGRGLLDRGYSVLHATTAAQAARLLHEVVPHIVVLDLSLPDGTGLDLLKRMRLDERFSDTEVIIVSGRTEYFERCKALGVRQCLEKPVTVVTIWDIVNRIVADKGLQPLERPSTREAAKPLS